MHWVDGGETSVENTILLCSRHHRVLHEGGFSIQQNHQGEWYFRNSNGKVLADGPVYVEDPPRDGLTPEVRETAAVYHFGSLVAHE